MPEGGAGTTTTHTVRIPRTLLLSRLTDDAARPLVVISAGAGFGKTTLAAQWAEHDRRPHATVRVARFMDDPAALALELVDALQSLGADVEDTRRVLTGAEPRFSAVALPALTLLAGKPPGSFVLVVDDVHLLTEPDCGEVLRAVSAGIPPGSQLALLSRSPLPQWVARARAEGRLVEVVADDLAFRDHESRHLLAGMASRSPRTRRATS